MKKSIIATSLLLSSFFASAERVEDINGFELRFQKYEIVTLENKEEVKFKTSTLKPDMILEENIKIKKLTKDNFKEFSYIYNLSRMLYFIDQDPENNNIKFYYSSNGKDFKKTLDSKNDNSIKIVIENPKKDEEYEVKVRFEHTFYRK